MYDTLEEMEDEVKELKKLVSDLRVQVANKRDKQEIMMRYFIGLLFFLSTVMSQVTAKNFKDEVGDGVTVIVFTSEWQEKELDSKIPRYN